MDRKSWHNMGRAMTGKYGPTLVTHERQNWLSFVSGRENQSCEHKSMTRI